MPALFVPTLDEIALVIEAQVNRFGSARVKLVSSTVGNIFFAVMTNDEDLVQVWRLLVLDELRSIEPEWRPMGVRAIYSLWADHSDPAGVKRVRPLMTLVNQAIARRAAYA